MNKCCHNAGASFAGYTALAGRWFAPVAILVLMPKCPACLAAYVLVFTGVGLSLAAASAIQWMLIGASLGALGYLVIRAWLWRAPSASDSSCPRP